MALQLRKGILHFGKKSSWFLFTKMMSSTGNEVIRTTVNTCAVLTLNRPKALNTLNLNMVELMLPELKKWNTDPNISHVIIEGAGDRAFCAGGDVVTITKEGKDSPEKAYSFFRTEYLVNHAIGTLSKPYIALIDGFVMGGGVGVSAHGSHRIATEKTTFAMPETAIGLFPDVGGGYLLPRLRGQLGTFLGLTGFRLKGADVVRAGIATHFVDSSKIETLKEALVGVNNANREEIDKLLANFQDSSEFNPTSSFILQEHLPDIERHFSHDSIEAILKSLHDAPSEWTQKQIDTIGKMSPTSLKITLRQLREGGRLNLADCLKMDYRLARQCVLHKDLYEGVRAALVDRDNQPKWDPATVEEVTEAIVDRHFSLQGLEKDGDLNL